MDTFRFNSKFQRSWLVQRLEPPIDNSKMGFKDNPFNFGGGYKNGGIPEEGMNLLRPIFAFDYMGSAEFEFGIVASTFDFISNKSKDFVAGQVEVEKDKPIVYFMCHKTHRNDVIERVKLLATNPPEAKEYVNLDHHFRETRYKTTAVGWLDCSNGFMFFVDKEMWEKTCRLFKVKIDDKN